MSLLYVDYAATTPLDERVLEAMMPYLTSVFYNATSSHAGGMQAQGAVIRARMDVARHIGAQFDEIVFTAGATESVNIAIQGCAAGEHRLAGARRTIVSVRSEHVAVRDTVARCAEDGFEIRWLPVDADGRIIMDDAERLIDDGVLFVSVMLVNNETGVLQNLPALSALAHRHGALMMTDATQAYGKIPINVESMGIDLMAFSGHKIYGPKGVGALYVRRSAVPLVRPLMVGGGQEGGLRSGTSNVAGIVGLAAAGNIAHEALEYEAARIWALRDKFESAMEGLPNVSVNCARVPRVSTISSVTFGNKPAELLLGSMPDIACSKGSACSSSKPIPSAVLTAMGRSSEQAEATLRFSFGRHTTEADIDRLIHTVTSAIEQTSVSHQS
jgi:cysteine desulfurase